MSTPINNSPATLFSDRNGKEADSANSAKVGGGTQGELLLCFLFQDDFNAIEKEKHHVDWDYEVNKKLSEMSRNRINFFCEALEEYNRLTAKSPTRHEDSD